MSRKTSTPAGDALTATLGSKARDVFARALETARSRLRETIESHRDTLPPGSRRHQGVFLATLWLLSEHEPEAEWWREQAIRYSKLAASRKDDSEPAGLGFLLFPESAGDP